MGLAGQQFGLWWPALLAGPAAAAATAMVMVMALDGHPAGHARVGAPVTAEMTTDTRFDDLIHAPHRLRICAMLAGVGAGAGEFGTLRDALGVSDSVLSKHLAALSDAGYVETKPGAGMSRRRRLWVVLTAEGRLAFQAHARALNGILAAGDGPGSTAGPADDE